MVFRVATVIAIPMATILVLALLGGFLVYRNQTNERLAAGRESIKNNREQINRIAKLTLDLDAERRGREQAIARAAFLACVQNEAQDAVLVDILNKTIEAVLRAPPTDARAAYIQNLRDAIRAREPMDEPECKIPPGGG
jgi:hypothetical protein